MRSTYPYVEPRAGDGRGLLHAFSVHAAAQLHQFINTRLRRYGDDSKHPDLDATSRLSPYLHFGHISSHEVFAAVMTAERWTTRKLSKGARGAREGWWGHVGFR